MPELQKGDYGWLTRPASDDQPSTGAPRQTRWEGLNLETVAFVRIPGHNLAGPQGDTIGTFLHPPPTVLYFCPIKVLEQRLTYTEYSVHRVLS